MIDTSRSMLYHLGNLNAESQRISHSIGTESKIDKGSEDSLLHSDLINLDDKLRVTLGLKLQIEKSEALNNTADTNIGEFKKALDSIKVDLIKALNDGMDRSDKTALSSNLKGIRQNLIDRINTQVDGEYLFTGSVTTKQTMVKDPNFDLNGKIEFGGDGFLRKIAVQPGTYRDRGVTAYDVAFYNGDSANAGQKLNFQDGDRIIDDNGNEWKLNENGNRLQKYDHNGVLIEPTEDIVVSTGKSESIKIDLGVGGNSDAKGDYTLKVSSDAGTYSFSYTAEANPAGGGYTNSAEEIFEELKSQIDAEVDADGKPRFLVSRSGDEITLTPNKGALNSSNISVEISETDNKYVMTATNEIEAIGSSKKLSTGELSGGVKSSKGTYQLTLPGDPEGRVFEAKRNYFDELNKIINALDGYTTKLDGTRGGEASDELVEDIIRTGLDITTKQFDATNVGHGELGGRNKVFEIAREKLTSQETNYEILIKKTGGADLAKLAMESKNLEVTYQALYATIAKMNNLSLVNFIR